MWIVTEPDFKILIIILKWDRFWVFISDYTSWYNFHVGDYAIPYTCTSGCWPLWKWTHSLFTNVHTDLHAFCINLNSLQNTSVARGGGGGEGGGAIAPNNAFSEFCRYIWKSVGTCKPTSMSFVPTKFLQYEQKIERNSSFRMWKCKTFLSSLAPLARTYIDFLNVSVLSAYWRL